MSVQNWIGILGMVLAVKRGPLSCRITIHLCPKVETLEPMECAGKSRVLTSSFTLIEIEKSWCTVDMDSKV